MSASAIGVPASSLAGVRCGQRALDLSRLVDDPKGDAIATVWNRRAMAGGPPRR